MAQSGEAEPSSIGSGGPASDPAELLATEDELVTIVNTRGGDGLGVSFKVGINGRMFRMEPIRDPDQPRFWCWRICPCSSAGVALDNERSWWGPTGMSRADLSVAVAGIRMNPNRWLADDALADLREWMLATEQISGGSELVKAKRANQARP